MGPSGLSTDLKAVMQGCGLQKLNWVNQRKTTPYHIGLGLKLPQTVDTALEALLAPLGVVGHPDYVGTHE